MRGTRRLVTVPVTAVLLASGLTACSSGPSPAPPARAYLAAWSRGDDAAAAATTDNASAARAALDRVRSRLHASRVRATLVGTSTKGDTATARFRATVTVAGLGDWTYDGRLALRRSGKGWRVHWEPADVHPRLTATTNLARERSLPDRAPILDGSGKPLFTALPVVDVGIEPARLHDPQHTIAVLAQVLNVDPQRLQKAVASASPHAFVPVITLRRSDYEKVKPQIYTLPGTVFVTGTRMLAPTSDFGRALLGRVGQATADVLKHAGAPYVAGDMLGTSGLQAAYQHRLAGTPSGAVVIRNSQDTTVATLHRFTGHPGQPVRTTVDRSLQQAAEAALSGVRHPAALVAVRPSDGAVLAVADAPGSSSYDRALVGRYPPGSTFKVLTTYALLGAGMTPDTPVDCPPTVNVGGRVFRNFEGEAKGSVPFRTDFAISCNTAFVNASRRLQPGDLHDAAAAFGIGGAWKLPVDAFTGSVPPPVDVVDKAAEAIGQGRIAVSPLVMALVAAAVESGTWRSPVLVTDPAQSPGPAPRRLDQGRIATLRALMRAVVASGTAAGAGLPGDVAGKTGTAEFGSGNPPPTHAWFIGFRGDLAFAVLVEGGGVGGRVAAPIAARFLRSAG